MNKNSLFIYMLNIIYSLPIYPLIKDSARIKLIFYYNKNISLRDYYEKNFANFFNQEIFLIVRIFIVVLILYYCSGL